MHEISAVRSLIRQVEALVSAQGGKATQIEVSIGPLSGFEPLLIQSAFSQLTAMSAIDGASLCILETELRASCLACGCSFSVDAFRFSCPDCESQAVEVISGDEFRLERISVSDDAAEETTFTQAMIR